MGYTLLDANGEPTPIRLIQPLEGKTENGEPRITVKRPFVPANWVNDACNRPAERYMIEFESGSITHLAWYQVAEISDTAEDLKVKIDHYKAVIQAHERFEKARTQYRILTGDWPDQGCTQITVAGHTYVKSAA